MANFSVFLCDSPQAWCFTNNGSSFQYVCRKVSFYIWLLPRIKSFLSIKHRTLFYNAYIQPHFNYCNIIWGNSLNKMYLK